MKGRELLGQYKMASDCYAFWILVCTFDNCGVDLGKTQVVKIEDRTIVGSKNLIMD